MRQDNPNLKAVSGQNKSTKHQSNSAQTRDRLMAAAQRLYAERGIDGVSLNEITTAAGQKNRNALQYHFGGKSGLLQAIVDKHATIIYQIRRDYLAQVDNMSWSASEAAARVLVMPVADYIASHAEGVDYIKINSQLVAMNMHHPYEINSQQTLQPHDREFAALVAASLSHLKPVESKRRIFLSVSIMFHSMADIYRASAAADTPKFLNDHSKMIEQLICSIDRLFSAPEQ